MRTAKESEAFQTVHTRVQRVRKVFENIIEETRSVLNWLKKVQMASGKCEHNAKHIPKAFQAGPKHIARRFERSVASL